MERLGEFDNKVIIEQYNEPENKNVICKDPSADEFKEYENGSWVKSRKIGSPNSGGGYEPYIVQGASIVSGDSYDMLAVPAEEYASAKEAFLAGRVVFIPEIDSIAYMVTGYSRDAVEVDGNSIEGLCLFARSTGFLSDSGVCTALISQ